MRTIKERLSQRKETSMCFIFVTRYFVDPVYLGVGPPIPQWPVIDSLSPEPSGVFLIPSSVFIHDTMVIAWEIYGKTAGLVTLFVCTNRLVIRRFCNVSSSV